MSGLAYLDSSALFKLLVLEPETAALQADILERAGLVASELAMLETRRALARRPGQAMLSTIDDISRALVLIEIGSTVVEQAALVAPAALRSLDAIHLATALSVGDLSLEVITYDNRMADAARANGLTVVQPGLATQT